MAIKYLDGTGLAYFWNKIKSYGDGCYLQLTGGTLTGALVGTDITAENGYLQLDTTATSGTDFEIYDALQELGWDSDVIV